MIFLLLPKKGDAFTEDRRFSPGRVHPIVNAVPQGAVSHRMIFLGPLRLGRLRPRPGLHRTSSARLNGVPGDGSPFWPSPSFFTNSVASCDFEGVAAHGIFEYGRRAPREARRPFRIYRHVRGLTCEIASLRRLAEVPASSKLPANRSRTDWRTGASHSADERTPPAGAGRPRVWPARRRRCRFPRQSSCATPRHPRV